MPERHIAFERCFNFRDLGGYETADGRRVAWRRLFRSMTPEYMSEADVAYARDELGVGGVIDLRRPTEPGMDSGPLGLPPARRLLAAFADARVYPELRTLPGDKVLLRGLELNAEPIIAALSFIADGDGATVFHCHTGKDRTGILAAVILKLLGVADADVVDDYLHSVAGFEALMKFELFSFAPDAPVFAKSPPEEGWITGVLAALEAYGGAEAYLKKAGATDELLARVREKLLE